MPRSVNTVEARVVVALGTEDGLDARLVLLALHSRVIDPKCHRVLWIGG